MALNRRGDRFGQLSDRRLPSQEAGSTPGQQPLELRAGGVFRLEPVAHRGVDPQLGLAFGQTRVDQPGERDVERRELGPAEAGLLADVKLLSG